MAATELTFATPLTGDANMCVLGANAWCCDELPATDWLGACDPTAPLPPFNGNDFDGDPPKASRIETSKSSKALLGGGFIKATGAGDEFRDLGGGGRAGGPAVLTWPLLALSPANNVCCASTWVKLASSVKNGFSSLPAACV